MFTQLKNTSFAAVKCLLISSFVVATGVVGSAAQAQTPTALVRQSVGLPDEVLYYLDGQKINKAALEALNPSDIASMNVLKGAQVREVLGEVSETQAILITTKVNENSAAVVALNKKINSSINLNGKLLLVDGKEVSRAEFSRLLPSQIYQMTMLSPEKAVEAYGDKGRSGSVQITTK